MWLHEHIIEETDNFMSVADANQSVEFEIWGSAPVQALGSLSGREFYFRARHDGWSCEVADDCGQLPSDGLANTTGFSRSGRYENASYIPLRDALKLINLSLREYLSLDA